MHSVLCNRVLLLIFKQRSTNMTNRFQGDVNAPILESFLDEETSPDLIIAGPSAGTMFSERAEDIELDIMERTRDIP